MKRNVLRLLTMLPLWALATLYVAAQQPKAAQQLETVEPSATTDQPDTLTVIPVSYTHLDVYKRQVHVSTEPERKRV